MELSDVIANMTKGDLSASKEDELEIAIRLWFKTEVVPAEKRLTMKMGNDIRWKIIGRNEAITEINENLAGGDNAT